MSPTVFPIRMLTIFIGALCVLLATSDRTAAAESLTELNKRSVLLVKNGAFAEAVSSAEFAANIARKAGKRDQATFVALTNYAEILRLTHNLELSKVYFDMALPIGDAFAGDSVLLVATAYNNFGLLASEQFQDKLALERYATSLRLRAIGKGADIEEYQVTINNIADIYLRERLFSQAELGYNISIFIGSAFSEKRHYARRQLAFLFEKDGRIHQARDEYFSLIKELAQLKNKDLIAIVEAHMQRSALAQIEGHFNDARDDIEAAKALHVTALPIAAQLDAAEASLERDLTHYDRAKTLYNDALQKLANGSYEYDRARIQNAEGMLLEKAGQYSAAEGAFRSAIDTFTHMRATGSYDLAAVSTNYGLLLMDSGRLEEAERPLERAVEIFNLNNDAHDPNYGSVLSNLGLLYLSEGRFDEAEAIFKKSADLQKGISILAYLIDLSNLADLYNQSSRWKEAEGATAIALSDIKKSSITAPLLEANLLHRRAVAQDNLGDRSIAIETLRKALKICPPDTSSHASITNDLADFLGRRGDLQSAKDLLSQSEKENLKIFGPSSPALANNLFGAGRLFASASDYPRALKSFSEGNDISINRLRMDWALSGSRIGRSRRRQIGSEYGFASEIQVASRLGLRDKSEQQKVAAREFEIAQWSNIQDSAFSVALMSARGIAKKTEVRDRLRLRQDAVAMLQIKRRSLIQLYTGPVLVIDQEVRASVIRSEISGIEAQIKKLDSDLHAEDERYMLTAAPAALSVRKVQDLLKSDEVMLLFFVTGANIGMEEETHVFIVTKKELHWHVSPMGKSAVEKLVQTLRCGLDPAAWDLNTKCPQLTDVTHDNGDPLPFRLDLAFAAYYQYISPFESYLIGKKLIIVNSGPLTTLPFSTLITRYPKHKIADNIEELAAARWLILEHPIVNLPDVNSLLLLRSKTEATEPPLDFLGLGDPLLSGNKQCSPPSLASMTCEKAAKFESVGSELSQQNRGIKLKSIAGADAKERIAKVLSFCPLPESSFELQCIANSVGKSGSMLLTQAAFSMQNLRTLDQFGVLSQYRIVYFATHGLLADDESSSINSEPALVSTPSGDDDGLVTTSEISRLHLDADGVVLAACDTASGSGGMKGLADAFFYAGARAIVVSNWETNSEATVILGSKLMAEFRGNGGSLVDAFQASIRSMIQTSGRSGFAQPEFWAPFVIVGDGQPRGQDK